LDGGLPSDILGIEGLVYNADISATLLLWSDLLLDIWPNEISPSLKIKQIHEISIKRIKMRNLYFTSLIGVVAPVEGEFRQFDTSIGGELGPEPGVLPEGDVSTEK